ncbi:MAG: hypothetical protein HYX79_10035 [Chloroflexi bacterium]|nr:hypothetical protein [Chloroflexota bacterium]
MEQRAGITEGSGRALGRSIAKRCSKRKCRQAAGRLRLSRQGLEPCTT